MDKEKTRVARTFALTGVAAIVVLAVLLSVFPPQESEDTLESYPCTLTNDHMGENTNVPPELVPDELGPLGSIYLYVDHKDETTSMAVVCSEDGSPKLSPFFILPNAPTLHFPK